MALGATWKHHAGPRGTYAGPRGAYAAYIIIYILHSIYNKGFQPSVYRKGIQSSKPSGPINPTCFTNLFRMGLKSHTVYLNAGDVA